MLDGSDDEKSSGDGTDGAGGGDGAKGGAGSGGDGKKTDEKSDQNSSGGADDLDGLKSALEKERSGHKAEAKRANDLEKRLKALEDAGRSDEEKREARLKELEARDAEHERDLRSARTDLALERAAVAAGAKRPAEVARLVDRDLVELDDDGKVTNADDVIGKTKERVPELFRGGKPTGDGDGGRRGDAAGGGEKKPSMNELIRRGAGH